MSTLALDGLTLQLREYQEDALARTAAAEERGVRRQLGVAATGLGKTIVFAALAMRRAQRTLILVHRDELARQAVDKVRQVWPDVDVGIVKAGDNEVHAQVVVASVQTVSRRARLNDLMLSRPFDLCVVDEAHHATADSYRRILGALGCVEWEEEEKRTGDQTDDTEVRKWVYPERDDAPLLLGVTATPDRGDGLGLDSVFDEIVWNYDILWGIDHGYLCDVRGLRVRVEQLDLGAVKMSRGDYAAGSAGQALEDAHAPEAIHGAWKNHAADRRTIVFTPTVETARLVAVEFRKSGATTAFVHAGTPLEERRAMLRAFNSGDVQVIANCGVLTEGFDEPRVDCIVVARPTKSRALFTQMVGRGTRKHPDKTDLLVLDVVGASAEHSLVTLPSLFGMDPREWPQLGDGTQNLTDAVAEFQRQQVKLGRMLAEEADLFGHQRTHGVVWINMTAHSTNGHRRYERPLTYRDDGGELVELGTVVIAEREPDVWSSWIKAPVPPFGAKVLIADVDLETAQGVGEDAVRHRLAGRTQLVDVNAPWRKNPPTERQLDAARRWRLPKAASYETAGALSAALDAHIAMKKAKEAANPRRNR